MNKTPTTKTERINAAAKRALQEAQDRKKNAPESKRAAELGGRDGPDPTRFGDWEKKGIISDF